MHEVRLNYPLFRTSLRLKRAPQFLRFVCKGIASCSRNWDALDAIDDVAEPDEQIIAGRLANRGTVHIDRTVNGRRVGEWLQTAEYELIEPQPDQETLRDNAKWQAWVMGAHEADARRRADSAV